jgi:probable addiction module antidote protein
MKAAKKTPTYHADLIQSLKEPDECAAYLNAALEDGDSKILLTAIRNVVEAHGGMRKLSAETRLARESLYRMLSKKGNPELASLEKVLHALGLKLSVKAKAS